MQEIYRVIPLLALLLLTVLEKSPASVGSPIVLLHYNSRRVYAMFLLRVCKWRLDRGTLCLLRGGLPFAPNAVTLTRFWTDHGVCAGYCSRWDHLAIRRHQLSQPGIW